MRWTRPVAPVVVALALLVVSAAPAARGPKQAPKGPDAVPGELIVVFARGVSDADRASALAAAGAIEKRRLRGTNARVAAAEPAFAEAALKRLAADPRVAYAEPNYRVYADELTPNDPSFPQLWGLANTGQTVNGVAGRADADIDADEAWSVTTGSRDVVVGVIDTGVDFGHPDLAAAAWTNPGESGAGRETNGVDDDGNGYVDDWRGWDFANDDNDPRDDEGHGTHVAGTIGAAGSNGIGVTGVNWSVSLMALKFLTANGTGTIADAIEATGYATAMGADVVNNSWGGGGFSQALLDALEAAGARGVLHVAAAGNTSSDNDVSPHYPSSYDAPNLIAVAATDSSDALASFSNRGRTTVDLGAPGVGVLSTVLAGGYDYSDGTSMAAPHVSGAAALAKAAFPAATALGLKALLLRSGDALPALATATRAGTRLNAGRAVACSGSPQVLLEAPLPGFAAAVGEAVAVSAVATACAAPGAAVSAMANGLPLELTPRGDGLYTGTVVPASAGPLAVEVTATVGGVSASESVTGTVDDTYRYASEPYAWIDAAAGGTRLSLGDDSSATLALPFAFTFFGEPFGSVKVSSNGYLVFGASAATAYANVGIPATAEPNGLAALYWDDLNPGAGGAVWARTVGTAPNRKLVVAWVGVPHYSGGAATFEVVLEEGTNDLVYQYADVEFGLPSLDRGASATVGVESATGARGRQYLYGEPRLANGSAIRFAIGDPDAPPPPPDTTAPAAPTGLAATAGELRVTLDWADNTEADVTGYRVYRSAAGGTWTRVAETAASAYTDSGLTAGTSYAYRVTAVDGAGNESAASAEAAATPFRAPISRSFAPAGVTILAGTHNGGSLSSLSANDGNRLEIQAQASGGSYVADFYARGTITPDERATLRLLSVTFDGRVTQSSAALSLRVFNWSTAAWETVAGPWTGVTSDRTATWTATTAPRDYVSTGGEVRFSVRGARSSGFRTQTDLVRFAIEY